MKDLLSLPVSELAKHIQAKEVSPVELTNDMLQYAQRKNHDLNAYIQFAFDDAKYAAKKAEQEIMSGHYKGMYHGVPMALKDNIFVQNQATTMGSKIHQNFIPDHDATVVKKLKEAGAVLTGKLNMHEYAYGITTNNPHYGAARNPWNPAKIPGGSSGGSGAAVSAHMTAASLGTDTAGSIRIPSFMCGIVGLKPTYGRVSNAGSFPLASSLDHIGPMTKTIQDAAGLLEIIAGADEHDPTTIDRPIPAYTEKLKHDVTDMVIGVDDYFFKQVDSAIYANVQKTIQDLVNRGAKVETIHIPSLERSLDAQLITNLSEAATLHHTNLLEREDDFGDDILDLFRLNEIPSAVDYLHAQELRKELKEDFNHAFKHVDVIIAPTIGVMPPDIGETFAELDGHPADMVTQTLRFTAPSNLTGLPSLSVPSGFKDGLPIGTQIIGPAFREDLILNIGFAVEQTRAVQMS